MIMPSFSKKLHHSIPYDPMFILFRRDRAWCYGISQADTQEFIGESDSMFFLLEMAVNLSIHNQMLTMRLALKFCC